jgi:hypothetical protein
MIPAIAMMVLAISAVAVVAAQTRVSAPWLDDFRVFLERHAALLRALPAWTLRIVVPPQFPGIGLRAKQVVWNQLLTPLRPPVIDELRLFGGSRFQ